MTAARKLWTDEHQSQLRQARLDAGVSDVAFARDNAITLRHLKQLEEGGSTAFYSESIKFDTGVKLLKRLGVEPVAMEEPTGPSSQDEQASSTPSAGTDAIGLDGQVVDESRSDSSPTKRVPYVVMSLAGLALIVAGISLIPSIHQPGATQGMAQTHVTSVAPSAEVRATAAVADESNAVKSHEPLPVGMVVGQAPLAPTTTAQPSVTEPCQASGAPQTIVPSQPSKSADYVYVTAVSDVILCVRDAAGQITRKNLQGGQSFNVPGRQPFELTADKLDQLRVFFQGQRIWFDAGATRLRLTAATAID
jgi:hypothetical protein